MSDASLVTPRRSIFQNLKEKLTDTSKTETLTPAQQQYRQIEFMIFAVIAFVGKSALLIRMPYRTVEMNTLYTSLLILLFYCFYRFRNKMIPPGVVIAFLAGAVAVDVFGNYFHLYGRDIGPLIILYG